MDKLGEESVFIDDVSDYLTASNGAQVLTLSAFSRCYPLYNQSKLLAYKVYADLMLQQEYDAVNIVDGYMMELQSYYFQVSTKDTSINRTLLPLPYNGSLDLAWLKRVLTTMDKDREIYICFVNQDAVIYYLVGNNL